MSVFKIFEGFTHVMTEVAFALIPLAVLFLIFQFLYLKLPIKRLIVIFKGMVMTFLGLSFFLQGVFIGFLPFGEKMGVVLGSLSFNWILIPVGFVLGFTAVFAEPAVKVLIYEVDKVSGGYIPEKVMLITLSIGVALSVALSMARIIFGFPFWYLVLPGYIIALWLIRYSKKNFVAIAFDSGVVATGPMTVTFILAMAVGVASAIEGRNPLVDGFGMIALAALTPIISVLILGILYGRREKENESTFSGKL